MTIKLTDTQLIILSQASQRGSGLVLPLPENICANEGAKTTVLKSLLAKGFIEEVAGQPSWRIEPDGVSITLQITAAGLSALRIDEPGEETQETTPVRKTQKGTKLALIEKLLRRARGVSVLELGSATGWQPHSLRAAMTGLRKKGFDIQTGKNTRGVTVYRLVSDA